MKVTSSAEVRAACTSRCWRRRPGRAGTSRCTSATARTTPSASAWCSPTRRSTPSRPTTPSPTSASAAASPTGATSTWSTRASVMRSGGNGFCGCSRVALLNILQDRGRELGVQMRFQREVEGLEEFADSDLVVVADGINSRIREKYKDHFQPSVDLRPNKFTWLGSTKPLDAFKYFFRETPAGHHPRALLPVRGRPLDLGDRDRRAHLAQLRLRPARARPRCCRCSKRVFAEELDGHPLIANRSLWRNFPTITNKTWVTGQLRCWSATPRRPRISPSARAPSWRWKTPSRCSRPSRSSREVQEALDALRHRAARGGREDPARRQRVARLVRAHEALLGHGAGAVRLRRDVALQADHLGEPRAARPGVRRAKCTAGSRRRSRSRASTSTSTNPPVPMFTPFRLRDMVVENRVVVSPMDQYSRGRRRAGRLALRAPRQPRASAARAWSTSR